MSNTTAGLVGAGGRILEVGDRVVGHRRRGRRSRPRSRSTSIASNLTSPTLAGARRSPRAARSARPSPSASAPVGLRSGRSARWGRIRRAVAQRGRRGASRSLLMRASVTWAGAPRLRRSSTAGPGFQRVRADSRDSRTATRTAGSSAMPRRSSASTNSSSRPPGPTWGSARNPNGHIQATGVDAAGPHPVPVPPGVARAEGPHQVRPDARTRAVTAERPARVTVDLRSEGDPAQGAGGGVPDARPRLRCAVGSERYAEQHGSHGLRHCSGRTPTVSGEQVSLAFPARAGRTGTPTSTTAPLRRLIRTLKRRGPKARLLAYQDDDGWHPLPAEDINEMVRDRTGGDFTSKDFRTLRGR